MQCRSHDSQRDRDCRQCGGGVRNLLDHADDAERAFHRLCGSVAQCGRGACRAHDEPAPGERRLAVEEPEHEASDGVEVGSRRRVRETRQRESRRTSRPDAEDDPALIPSRAERRRKRDSCRCQLSSGEFSLIARTSSECIGRFMHGDLTKAG